MRWLRRIGLVVAVLIVVAIVIAWSFPAQLAWRWFGPRAGSVQLAGISGSIWHGHADHLSIAAVPIGALDWRVAPTSLLHGKLRAQVTISGDLVNGHGQLTRLRDGRIDMRDLQLTMPAASLRNALGLQTLQLLGTFHVDIKHAIVRNTWFDALDGHARWHDAGIAGPTQARFGDVLGDFSLNAAKQVVGTLHDTGGPLAVDGRFRGSLIGYHLIAHLRARDADSYNLQQALMYLGQRQPDGSVVLHVSGHAQLPTL